jgi:AcrR family transcriptional regulator
MPGKPAFDESAVILQAVKTFWSRGYSGTSIADIIEATGLSRSSLYQRFGDKDGLFAEALNAYHALVLRKLEDAVANATSDPIGTILRDFKDGADSRPLGCFVARSIAELAVLPDDLKKLARECLHEQHAFFCFCYPQHSEGRYN